eukprot:INCI1520.1.p1 GENE.INCI1520.1~~INCI1520.1.p1  ORF type:complete len:434 (-),score=64.26 INCI1520.1:240-1541(-)
MTPEDRAAVKIQAVARAALSRQLFTSPRRKMIRKAGKSLSMGLAHSLQGWLLRLGWSKVSGIAVSTFMAGYVARKSFLRRVSHLQVLLVLVRDPRGVSRKRRQHHHQGRDSESGKKGQAASQGALVGYDGLLSMPLCEDKPLDVVFASDSTRKLLVRAALRKLRTRRGYSFARHKSGFGQLGRWWGARAPLPSSSGAIATKAQRINFHTQGTKTVSSTSPIDTDGGDSDAELRRDASVFQSADQGDTRILDGVGAEAAQAALADAGDCLRTLFSPGALALAMGGKEAAVEEEFIFTLAYLPLASHSSPRCADSEACTCSAERDNRLTLVVMRKSAFDLAARSDFYLLNQHNLGGCCGSAPTAALKEAASGENRICRHRHVDNAWRAVHALALGSTGGTEVDAVSVFVSPPRGAAYPGPPERPRRAGFFTRSKL